ncbi:hypothetical protein N9026_00170 [bacterium]|nr:hypothetical protein [bacterium]
MTKPPNFSIKQSIQDAPLSDNGKECLERNIEYRKRLHPEEEGKVLYENTIKELVETQAGGYRGMWLKLYPPANQLPGSKYKTITDAQLAAWEWDENHTIHINMSKERLLDWFDNVPVIEDEPEDEKFDFVYSKDDGDEILITESNPDFWTECSQEDFEQAVLDRFHLKAEWLTNFTVDG